MFSTEKGRAKTGGRVKGTPNKATKELKDAILKALKQAGGVKYLVEQAHKNPTAFLALVGKILPRDIKADISITDSLSERIKKARERSEG